MTKIEKINSWNFFLIFWSNIAIYLSLGLHKGSPSYRWCLRPSKENIQHFKTWKFLTFYIFVDHFSPPGSESRFQIRIHGPDRIRIQTGSGTLTSRIGLSRDLPEVAVTTCDEPANWREPEPLSASPSARSAFFPAPRRNIPPFGIWK